MRAENNAGQATIAANTGSMKHTLDNVTSQSGGEAISTVIEHDAGAGLSNLAEVRAWADSLTASPAPPAGSQLRP